MFPSLTSEWLFHDWLLVIPSLQRCWWIKLYQWNVAHNIAENHRHHKTFCPTSREITAFQWTCASHVICEGSCFGPFVWTPTSGVMIFDYTFTIVRLNHQCKINMLALFTLFLLVLQKPSHFLLQHLLNVCKLWDISRMYPSPKNAWNMSRHRGTSCGARSFWHVRQGLEDMAECPWWCDLGYQCHWEGQIAVH